VQAGPTPARRRPGIRTPEPTPAGGGPAPPPAVRVASDSPAQPGSPPRQLGRGPGSEPGPAQPRAWRGHGSPVRVVGPRPAAHSCPGSEACGTPASSESDSDTARRAPVTVQQVVDPAPMQVRCACGVQAPAPSDSDTARPGPAPAHWQGRVVVGLVPRLPFPVPSRTVTRAATRLLPNRAGPAGRTMQMVGAQCGKLRSVRLGLRVSTPDCRAADPEPVQLC
jgi:hypothetical protein